MMPGHEDREDTTGPAHMVPWITSAAMMPGHEDREDREALRRRDGLLDRRNDARSRRPGRRARVQREGSRLRAAMMPGHEDREDLGGLLEAGVAVDAAMMPGHEDREDDARRRTPATRVIAAMMPGHEDREDMALKLCLNSLYGPQ